MKAFSSLQLLTCLMVYAPCVHSIMVKFGTNDGPIVPPTPEPVLPPPQPYRVPAPVWEERSNDSPDPNAHWRPQLFIPQPRYTHIIFNVPTPAPLSNAQRFANSYIPTNQKSLSPIQAQVPKDYITPSQILSSQSLPGFGLRYFVPAYVDKPKKDIYRQEDALQNNVGSNDVNEPNRDSASDLQWKFEKDLAKRVSRNTREGVGAPYYQWPAYVPSRHL
ncbi:unnamed protein product [Diatraea saccharalis]|uniref:Uncharacterized protein n=1 Tax=Diatraea saccharalis TaxID=40085 RepID=A0A9N9QWT5_9NEOP|nr:unnamed protein product [Diatraea saccharalis]